MTAPLPRLLLLTDRRACAARGRTLVDTVAVACAAGIRAVVLREKDLGRGARRRLARELTAQLAGWTGHLIIASDAELAAELGAGVHLAASDPPPAGRPRGMMGRSCHDLVELHRAAAERAAYVTLSPIFASGSKPGYGPALGVGGLRAGVVAVPALPVYALGGVRAENAGPCLGAGAAGVAVMGSVMGAEDPFAAARALLAVLGGGRDQPKRPAAGR